MTLRTRRFWASTTMPLAVAVAAWAGGLGWAPLGVAVLGIGVAARFLLPDLRALDAVEQALTDLSGGAGEVVARGYPVPAAEVVRVIQELRGQEALARAESARLEARFTNILQRAPAGLMLVGEDGRVQLVNEALCRLVVPRLGPEGRLPMEAFSLVELHEALEECALKGHSEERICASGTEDVAVQAVAVAEGMLVMVRDVSRYKQAERARTDFVANVSHELRTPIAAIMGYSETLLADRDRLPVDLAGLVDVVHRNGTRLSRLFDDLLRLYKVETRRRQLTRDRVRLRPILEDAVLAAADRAAIKKQAFMLTCPDDLEAILNPEAIGSIVSNLASNACKYTPEGGQVHVHATRDEQGVRIDVEDNGVGIPEAHQERIFERFYRVDERSRMAGGAGLGLAIVKHLAMASGCEVTLTSDAGSGSVFTVRLPAEPSAPDEAGRVWEATLR